MSTAHPYAPHGHALCKRWIATYNEYLFLTIALRDLARSASPMGLIRELTQEKAVQLTDLADQLQTLGYRPSERFAGQEAGLWNATLKLVAGLLWQTPPQDTPHALVRDDYNKMDDGWKQFQQLVAGLPDDFCNHLPSLDPQFYRPDSVQRLIGTRRQGLAASTNGVQPDHVL